MRESNYARFLRADFGCDFHEYLGIEMPVMEVNIFGLKFRMRSPRERGEWCNTRQAAKASYKVDMARRRGRPVLVPYDEPDYADCKEVGA